MVVFGILASLQAEFMLLSASLAVFDWTVLVDIGLVSLIVYSGYVLIRGTRALRILLGIGILALLYLIGRALSLTALNFLLQSIVTVTLVAIPVVFQPELRAALERLGRGELISGILRRAGERADLIRQLAGAVAGLAEKHVGALVVIERSTGLKDLADTGVMLDAAFSPELLRSIFNPKAPLHDGAIIIRGERILAASVFLPLTEEFEDAAVGTRHRAAAGLSKETDALVIVVSEETGRLSLAHRGKLEPVTADKLETKLRRMLTHSHAN